MEVISRDQEKANVRPRRKERMCVTWTERKTGQTGTAMQQMKAQSM
ncbi:hypothetical protein M3J09_001599 [Ascochyta lentis]